MSSGGRKGTKTNDGTITKRSNSVEDGLKKGPWMESEDAILADYVRNNGEGNWNSVRKNTGLLRCGKSCRLRWSNHLKPDLKKIPFSIDEEALIVDLHSKIGNKWARMASELPGRTDNEIKNFWNTRIKRRQRSGLSHQFQQDGVVNQPFVNQAAAPMANPVFRNQAFYPNTQHTQFNFRPPFRVSTTNWLNPNLDNFKPIPLVQPPPPLGQYVTAANHALGSYTTMMMGAIDNNSLPTGLPSIQTTTAIAGDGNGNGDIGMMKSFSTNSNNFYGIHDTCDLLNAVVRDVTSSPQTDTSKRVILFEDEEAEQGVKRYKQRSLSDDLQAIAATASGESLMNMPNLTSSQSSIGGGGMETSEEMREEMNSTDEDDLTHLLDFSYSPLPDWYRKPNDDDFM